MLKGLEALKQLQRRKYGTIEEFDKKLSIIEKDLKALAIIKDKKVFVANLIYHFENNDNVIEYNRNCGWAKSELTQKEYDLLKEILC